MLLAVILGACNLKAREEQQITNELPDALFTSAAYTAEARRLMQYKDSPTPSTTPQPGATAGVGDPAGSTPVPTQPAATPLPDVPTDETIPENDRAEFVDDITVPDGERYAPGARFIKTWRLKNTGTTTWTTGYALIFISGSLMDGPPTASLPNEVAPGATVDVSVELTAPTKEGIYQGFWKLRTANGQIFGVGADGVDAIWVTISVDLDLAGVASSTPIGKVIEGARLRVDNPDRIGTCPQVFRITAEFSLSRAATVAYSLEAGSQENTPIKLPPAAMRNLDAGGHTLVFELTFATTIHGWVHIHFTQPDDVTSEKVEFSLVCQ